MTAVDKPKGSGTRPVTKDVEAAPSPLMRDWFSASMYKRSQGRIARHVTFGALAVVFAYGAWSLDRFLLSQMGTAAAFGCAVAFLAIGCWIAFRLVNMPRFADFLISVEAEMNKVSWPTRTELLRSSIVVILMIFGLASLLFIYDVLWKFLLGPNMLNVIG